MASGAELVGLEFAVKSEESLTRKLESEQRAKKCTAETALGRMYDINRYTMVNDEEHLTDTIKTAASQLESQGYRVERVKNTLGDMDASYRGVNTIVRTPDGKYFEVQFHTKKSLEVKEINHKLYEEQRLDSTAESRQAELASIMRENAATVQTPTSIEEIVSFDHLK